MFVSFNAQHQHPPTQPHRTLNLSVFSRLEISFLNRNFSDETTRVVKKWRGEKKQVLFLYCIFTFLYFMLRLPS